MSGLPITISDSDFTVGAVSSTPLAKIATRFAEAVINTTWEEAKASKTDLEAKIAAVMTDFLNTSAAPHVTAGSVSVPAIDEPNVSIPTSIDTANIMSMFDTKYLELVALLADKLVNFRDTYFPNEQAAYAEVETWLKDALANPEVGLPAAVAAQIWGDDQARILADKVRAQDAIVAQFAGRRYPLPPDASASAVLQIEQKTQDELAESSRKVAILSVEMQKFNAEKLLGLRQLAMSSAVDYIKALASGPDMASKLIGVGYDAQSKLISSVSQFYNARTQAKETMSKVAQYNNSTALEAAVKNQTSDLTLIEDKLKALLTECQVIGQMTNSLFNNLHADAGVTAKV